MPSVVACQTTSLGPESRQMTVAGTSRRYPHHPTIASPKRSQLGFDDPLMGERYSTPLASFPAEQADRECADDDRDGRHAEQWRQLWRGPQPRVLEPLDAWRREFADPHEHVGQEHARQVYPAEEHDHEEHRD